MKENETKPRTWLTSNLWRGKSIALFTLQDNQQSSCIQLPPQPSSLQRHSSTYSKFRKQIFLPLYSTERIRIHLSRSIETCEACKNIVSTSPNGLTFIDIPFPTCCSPSDKDHNHLLYAWEPIVVQLYPFSYPLFKRPRVLPHTTSVCNHIPLFGDRSSQTYNFQFLLFCSTCCRCLRISRWIHRLRLHLARRWGGHLRRLFHQGLPLLLKRKKNTRQKLRQQTPW